jgi:hypothetical protein
LKTSRCARFSTLEALWLSFDGGFDLRAMAVVTAAITAERLASSGERVARAIGAAVVGLGLCVIARAAGLG